MVCVLSVVHFNSVTFHVQRCCQCVFSVISLVFELITLENTGGKTSYRRIQQLIINY